MTLPPPPDPYGSQPPHGGGQPGGGVSPQWGSQQGGVPPQGFGGGYGPPPQGPWGPQQQWPGGPGGQPPEGGRGKWILGGIAVVLAIALAVVITVLVVRPADGRGGNGDPTQQNGDSEFASADDTGPVNIIAEDPTCEAWARLGREYSQKQKAVSWGQRDTSIPASNWSAEQRTMYESVASAMTETADQAKQLAKQTPHRVMRELYEQFIAYSNDFVKRVPNYTEGDHDFAVVTDSIGNALNNICAAIDFRAAQPIKPLVENPPAPTDVSAEVGSESLGPMLIDGNSICTDWEALVPRFDTETSSWRAIDANIAASSWTPDQKAINESVIPVMVENADALERLGRASGSSAVEDIAVLAAQYRRATAKALPAYTPVDNYLAESAVFLVKVIDWGCKAA